MASDIGWDQTKPLIPRSTEPATRINRFADVKTVTELIYRVVGAGAGCADSDIFDMARAIQVGNDAIDRLIEMGWTKPEYDVP